jgi:glycosyltransferase involved in cell wall biosynthesis
MSLKVAFLTYGYGKDNLGLGRSAWYLANELIRIGVAVDVYKAQSHLEYFGPPEFYLKNALTNFNKYEIVHSNEGAGLLVHHPRMVETYHHNYKEMTGLNNRVFSKLEHFHCKHVQSIIVPSINTKIALLRHGFSAKKISYIPHGVDGDIFKRLPDKALLKEKYKLTNKFVAINVGQLIPRKKQVEAVKLLSGIKDAVLILVGKGPEEGNINRASIEFGVRLLHFQNITDEMLVELYNASDIYLNTSILEGFGLTLLEAMSCEVPIIAYETADFKTIVEDSGIILDNGDAKGARDAIELLKANEDLRESLSKAAFRRSKEFTWQNVAKQHVKVYKELLS